MDLRMQYVRKIVVKKAMHEQTEDEMAALMNIYIEIIFLNHPKINIYKILSLQSIIKKNVVNGSWS